MTSSRFYWEQHTDGKGQWLTQYPDGPPKDELASIRRGLGKKAGYVPSLWPFYTKLNTYEKVDNKLIVEHQCLTLYALHQQSISNPVHVKGHGLGMAIRALAFSESYQENKNAITKKLYALAMASNIDELANHLRNIITLIKSVSKLSSIDYTKLYWDLIKWNNGGDERSETILRWGMQYHYREKLDQNAE